MTEATTARNQERTGRPGWSLFVAVLLVFLAVVIWLFLMSQDITILLFGVFVAGIGAGSFLLVWAITREPEPASSPASGPGPDGDTARLEPAVFVVAVLAAFFTVLAFVFYELSAAGSVHDTTVFAGMIAGGSLALVLLMAAWVWTDARIQGMPGLPWALTTFLLTAFGFALYLVTRELRRTRKVG